MLRPHSVTVQDFAAGLKERFALASQYLGTVKSALPSR
jgi:hypothetical protein